MGIKQRKVPSHWNYFLSVEEDLIKMSRWIEFDKANSDCYSTELARLLMVASAEVDVVAKMLCKAIDPATNAGSINAYQDVIKTAYKQIHLEKIEMPKYGLTLTPWNEWKKKASPPIWWQANNKVKHHRSDYFSQATLKNALNSVGGLFVLLTLYYGRELPSISPAPSAFEPGKYGYKDGNFLVFRNV